MKANDIKEGMLLVFSNPNLETPNEYVLVIKIMTINEHIEKHNDAYLVPKYGDVFWGLWSVPQLGPGDPNATDYTWYQIGDLADYLEVV